MIFYSVSGKNGLAVMLDQIKAEKLLLYMGYMGKVKSFRNYMEAESHAKESHERAGGKVYRGKTKANRPIWNKNI